jgi:hypothetical protein
MSRFFRSRRISRKNKNVAVVRHGDLFIFMAGERIIKLGLNTSAVTAVYHYLLFWQKSWTQSETFCGRIAYGQYIAAIWWVGWERCRHVTQSVCWSVFSICWANKWHDRKYQYQAISRQTCYVIETQNRSSLIARFLAAEVKWTRSFLLEARGSRREQTDSIPSWLKQITLYSLTSTWA